MYKQVMHNAIAHHSLTDAQPNPEQSGPLPPANHPYILFSMTSDGMEYPSGLLGHLSWVWPLPALTAPPACLLAGQSKRLRCPWLSISTALQQLKHRGVISTLLILSQNTAFHQLLGRKLILC